MRKNGFYWVKYNSNWIVAEWDDDSWALPGAIFSPDLKDSNFELIIELPLTPLVK
jgi:hypothetical protein